MHALVLKEFLDRIAVWSAERWYLDAALKQNEIDIYVIRVLGAGVGEDHPDHRLPSNAHVSFSSFCSLCKFG